MRQWLAGVRLWPTDKEDDMPDRIDIRAETKALCHKLGLDESWVARLEWTPTLMTAEVFTPNKNGAKHIDPETGDAAKDTLTFDIRA